MFGTEGVSDVFLEQEDEKRKEDLKARARQLIAEARGSINKPPIEGIDEMAQAVKEQATIGKDTLCVCVCVCVCVCACACVCVHVCASPLKKSRGVGTLTPFSPLPQQATTKKKILPGSKGGV